MENLLTRRCTPCEKGGSKMTPDEIDKYIHQIPGWEVRETNGIQCLEKTYTFKNFIEALEFTNQIGRIAEEQWHHPTLVTDWGKVTVTWVTHKIKGLHINDFSMAARTDHEYSS